MSRRVLLVLPHASRSGSTNVILGLVRRGIDQGRLEVAPELRSSGPLEGEVLALGPRLAPGEVPRAVLVNSVLAARAVLDHPGVASAVYLHESATVLATLPEADLEGLRQADLVLCVSEQIQADAVAYGVEPERCELVPPLIEPADAPTEEQVADARRAMGLAPDERVVLGCGEARWGKGPDLFVAAARELRSEGWRFAWVGRRLRSLARQLDHDVAAAGLSGRLRWTGSVEDVRPYLAAADLLLVTSRDDPQPLVPLEAALVGVPTVGFSIGGLRDLAAAGAARTVAYPDVVAMAAAARELVGGGADGPGPGLVAAARERVAQRQRPEVVVPRFLDAIDRIGATGTW